MDMQGIAKAGWLHRRSTILHRWKKYWFVLRTDGDLLYFESQDVPQAEERIVVPSEVTRIKPAHECLDVSPPDNFTRDCLLGLAMRSGDTVILCAESPDDMRAWQIALEEARVMTHGVHPPVVRNVQTVYTGPYPGYSMYSGYPGQVISYPGQQVVYTNPAGYPYTVDPANPNVVYIDNRRRHRYSGDIATGVLAGAAIGSMFMWPYMFW